MTSFAASRDPASPEERAELCLCPEDEGTAWRAIRKYARFAPRSSTSSSSLRSVQVTTHWDPILFVLYSLRLPFVPSSTAFRSASSPSCSILALFLLLLYTCCLYNSKSDTFATRAGGRLGGYCAFSCLHRASCGVSTFALLVWNSQQAYHYHWMLLNNAIDFHRTTIDSQITFTWSLGLLPRLKSTPLSLSNDRMTWGCVESIFISTT